MVWPDSMNWAWLRAVSNWAVVEPPVRFGPKKPPPWTYSSRIGSVVPLTSSVNGPVAS